jgi:hypothetical protein
MRRPSSAAAGGEEEEAAGGDEGPLAPGEGRRAGRAVGDVNVLSNAASTSRKRGSACTDGVLMTALRAADGTKVAAAAGREKEEEEEEEARPPGAGKCC